MFEYSLWKSRSWQSVACTYLSHSPLHTLSRTPAHTLTLSRQPINQGSLNKYAITCSTKPYTLMPLAQTPTRARSRTWFEMLLLMNTKYSLLANCCSVFSSPMDPYPAANQKQQKESNAERLLPNLYNHKFMKWLRRS